MRNQPNKNKNKHGIYVKAMKSETEENIDAFDVKETIDCAANVAEWMQMYSIMFLAVL